jgi:hypothetical protein
MVSSAGGGTIDITGKGTGKASNQGDTEGARGRTDAVQVEGEGESKCRR